MYADSLILMATYNGEQFIREQIDSIRSQTYTDWVLMIRDDDSTDETPLIIKEYAEMDERIVIADNIAKQGGAYFNFWTLIHNAQKMKKFKFYFFADQDDIWPAERMQWMINEAEKKSEQVPLFIYGDMEIIDKDGNCMYESLNKIMGIGRMSGFTEYYSSGFVWGCNTMINYALFSQAPADPLDDPYSSIMSHDNYYAKYALAIGNVIFINKSCIKHRRHYSNTTGNNTLALSPLLVFKKVLFGFESLAKTHAIGYRQTLQTIKALNENKQGNCELEKVKRAIETGGFPAVFIMIKQKVKRKQFPRTCGIYFVMLLKAYKKYL